MNDPHTRLEHSLLEDAQAFTLGTALCAFAVVLLTHLGLITGQTAGLGVLLSYVSGLSFGLVFFLVNLPFYLFAWARMGPRFTIKSFIAVAMVSLLAEIFAQTITFDTLNPIVGALLAGATAGMGLIVLFRHGASLGGVGVVGLWLQDKAGIQAGWVQLGFDILLFAIALFVLPDLALVAWSLLGAVVVNLIIAVNHRKDRYVGR
ncbi:MAG: YitT family protein [Pseudomonadota bacterium]